LLKYKANAKVIGKIFTKTISGKPEEIKENFTGYDEDKLE